ncbi:AAA family ATPase, partial [Pseudomonas viridiflava]|uniref:AAA family ATPase n=1 Tax=Pseudomonas viridiflava TaxID=33069 RepID=UPI0023F87AC9
MLDGSSLLLMEEPEISLNDAIVKEIPLMLNRLQRNKRLKRQILISTHSEALLSNPNIDPRGVFVIETGPYVPSSINPKEDKALTVNLGLTITEV